MTETEPKDNSVQQPSLHSEDDAERALVDSVKSAILDRLLSDLRHDRPIARLRSMYSKSDSGVYGKYEKQDIPNEAILAAIRATLEDIVTGYETPATDHVSLPEEERPVDPG